MERCADLGGNIIDAKLAIEEGRLTSAAEHLCRQMTLSEISAVLRPVLNAPSARPAQIHKAIASLRINRFVTTNYDHLLERQMMYRDDGVQFLTVTNRNLAELADIQKASANNFIFKAHGDINDAQSIVLSDSHYDAVFGRPENPARQTLETIFMSRPVLFLGYGLRDPDLELILSKMKGRYEGNGGALWAILPDLTQPQKTQLWDQYRIRAFTYATSSDPGSARHADLLRLISSLGRASEQRLVELSSTDAEAKFQASLARYAARLVKPLMPKFPSSATYQSGGIQQHFPFYQIEDLEAALGSWESDVIVIGPAGSGKSYSITRFVSTAAQTLLDHIANDNRDMSSKPLLPIRLDCQAYSGRFQNLLEAAVPAGLDMKRASAVFRIVLLVDSIDELPSQYLEDQTWWSDLQNVRSQLSNPTCFYFSRRAGLVPDAGLPCAFLNDLPDAVVDKAMSEFGIEAATVSPMLRRQLTVPFLLEMARNALRRGKYVPSAWHLLRAHVDELLERLDIAVSDKDGVKQGLSTLAAATLMLGRETFSVELFKANLSSVPGYDSTLASRLVEVGLLKSEIERRLRFTHRTLTEYFASHWIKSQWLSNSFDLDDALKLVQLDNAIVWAAAGMTNADATALLTAIATKDVGLGIRVAQQAEGDTVALWQATLKSLQSPSIATGDSWQAAYLLKESSVPSEALPSLLDLANSAHHDEIAGAALGLAAPLMSDAQLKEVFQQMADGDWRYNSMSQAGKGVAARLSESSLLPDFQSVLAQLDFSAERQKDGSDVLHAFESVLQELSDAPTLAMLKWAEDQRIEVQEFVASVRKSDDTYPGLAMAQRLLSGGSSEVVFPLFLWYCYRRNPGDIFAYSVELFDTLLHRAVTFDENKDERERWNLHLLRIAVDRSDEWRERLKERLAVANGGDSVKLLSVLDPSSRDAALKRWISDVLSGREAAGPIVSSVIKAFDDFDLFSAFDEKTIVEGLRALGGEGWSLFEPMFMSSRTKDADDLDLLDAWIDLLLRQNFGHDFNLAMFIGERLSANARSLLLSRINDPNDSHRDILLLKLFPRCPSLNTDHISHDACLRLVELYFRDGSGWSNPAGSCTEKFMEAIFLPYLRARPEIARSGAALEFLSTARQTHDRRYSV